MVKMTWGQCQTLGHNMVDTKVETLDSATMEGKCVALSKESHVNQT